MEKKKKRKKITKQKRRIEGGMNRTNEDKENVSEVRRWPKLEKNSTHEPALKLGYLTPQNCIRELGGTWWRNPDFPFQAGTEERRNKFSDLTRALTACLSMRSKICYRLLFQENWWKVHHCMCVSVCLHAHVCVCVCVERSSECLQCPVLTHPTLRHMRGQRKGRSHWKVPICSWQGCSSHHPSLLPCRVLLPTIILTPCRIGAILKFNEKHFLPDYYKLPFPPNLFFS